MPDLNVSESVTPAPGSDSAATTTGSTAADTTSAAAPTASEVAAPSTQGAPDAETPRTLDSIREKYRKRAEEEAAPAEASPTTVKPDTEKPEEPKADEEAEAADVKPAEEADPLAEFEEPKPLTREQIDEQYPRVPKAVREQWAASEEERGRLRAEREALGGEQGVAVAKAIAPALWHTSPGEAEADALLDAVSEANQPLAVACGQRLVRTALDDDETGPQFGDTLVAEWFGKAPTGEGYTADRLRKLVEADNAGLIDWEELDADIAAARAEQPSAREAELEARVKELEGQAKQSPDEKARASAAEEQRRKDEEAVDRYVTDRAVAKVLPIAVKQGLAAGDDEEGAEDKVLFGEILTAWLNERVKAFPESHGIRDLKKNGTAYRNGQPTSALIQQTDSLEMRAKALFLETVRKLRVSQTIPVPTKRPPTRQPPTDGDGGGERQPPTRQPTQPPAADDAKPKSLEEIKAKFRRRAEEEAAEAQVGVAGRR